MPPPGDGTGCYHSSFTAPFKPPSAQQPNANNGPKSADFCQTKISGLKPPRSVFIACAPHYFPWDLRCGNSGTLLELSVGDFPSRPVVEAHRSPSPALESNGENWRWMVPLRGIRLVAAISSSLAISSSKSGSTSTFIQLILSCPMDSWRDSSCSLPRLGLDRRTALGLRGRSAECLLPLGPPQTKFDVLEMVACMTLSGQLGSEGPTSGSESPRSPVTTAQGSIIFWEFNPLRLLLPSPLNSRLRTEQRAAKSVRNPTCGLLIVHTQP
ncbi:hypothetical protein QBC43DRAFT_366280 [Cladorrhinum sp. PSN259]|nr:hypothetical protein QBC43DRAFT_366280 [Cladorrhinum sp. PSN259]